VPHPTPTLTALAAPIDPHDGPAWFRRANEMSAIARTARAQRRILDALTKGPADGLQSEVLAARIGRSKSAVRRTLAQLVDAGTVEKVTDRFDHRCCRYRITNGA
jgi:DNA-binding MarR family transcriptional regulator